jgi:hypothetical protein
MMRWDGCYLTLDTVRGDLISSGFAEQGLGRRWKEHLRASIRNLNNAVMGFLEHAKMPI